MALSGIRTGEDMNFSQGTILPRKNPDKSGIKISTSLMLRSRSHVLTG